MLVIDEAVVKPKKRGPKPILGYGPAERICVNRTVLSRILMIADTNEFDTLLTDGIFKKNDKGLYPLVESIHTFLAYTKTKLKMWTVAETKRRFEEARAAEIELRTAIRAGEVVPMEDARALVADLCGAFRAAFGSVSAQITRDLDLRRKIDQVITDGLNKIADQFAEKAGELMQYDGDVADDPADDGE